MIPRLSFATFFLIAVGIGAALATYGEIDPCRMLAKEKAMQAEKNAVVKVFKIDPEPIYRMQTSQYSTGRCTKELVESWWDRARA
jgi:hypothetical protein